MGRLSPASSLGLDLTHRDRQVRERLENPSHAAATARGETFDDERLADMRLCNDQIVDIEIVVFLRIGDRRLQALPHVPRVALPPTYRLFASLPDLPPANHLP